MTREPLPLPNLIEIPMLYAYTRELVWNKDAGTHEPAGVDTYAHHCETLAGARRTATTTRVIDGVRHTHPGIVHAFMREMLPVVTDEIPSPKRTEKRKNHRNNVVSTAPRQNLSQLLVRSEIERLVRYWTAIAMIDPTFEFAEEMLERWGEAASAAERKNGQVP